MVGTAGVFVGMLVVTLIGFAIGGEGARAIVSGYRTALVVAALTALGAAAIALFTTGRARSGGGRNAEP